VGGRRRARHADRADHRRVVVNYAKTWFTSAYPELWLFALGGLFVAVTLLLPKGIVGTWNQFWSNRRDHKAARLAAARDDEPPRRPPPAPTGRARAESEPVAGRPGPRRSGPEPQPAE
jgi:urea transport system permease protein